MFWQRLRWNPSTHVKYCQLECQRKCHLECQMPCQNMSDRTVRIRWIYVRSNVKWNAGICVRKKCGKNARICELARITASQTTSCYFPDSTSLSWLEDCAKSSQSLARRSARGPSTSALAMAKWPSMAKHGQTKCSWRRLWVKRCAAVLFREEGCSSFLMTRFCCLMLSKSF